MISLTVLSIGGAGVIFVIIHLVRAGQKPIQDVLKDTYGPDACKTYVRKTWPEDEKKNHQNGHACP